MQKKTAAKKAAAATEFPRPLVTVDVAILTLKPASRSEPRGGLQVLLVQRPGGKDEPYPHAWALPGGFVDVQRDADLEDCARRKLREKTNVSSTYLEQVKSRGGSERDPRGWSVTCVYFALLSQAALSLEKGGNAADVRWFDVHLDGTVPKAGLLAFDHGKLLAEVLQRLQSRVEYTSLPAFLLPAPFTLPQLQAAYESVLGRSLDRSAFRRRALAMPGFLLESGVIHTGAPRAPQGYVLENSKKPVTFPRTFEPRSHP